MNLKNISTGICQTNIYSNGHHFIVNLEYVKLIYQLIQWTYTWITNKKIKIKLCITFKH